MGVLPRCGVRAVAARRRAYTRLEVDGDDPAGARAMQRGRARAGAPAAPCTSLRPHGRTPTRSTRRSLEDDERRRTRHTLPGVARALLARPGSRCLLTTLDRHAAQGRRHDQHLGHAHRRRAVRQITDFGRRPILIARQASLVERQPVHLRRRRRDGRGHRAPGGHRPAAQVTVFVGLALCPPNGAFSGKEIFQPE